MKKLFILLFLFIFNFGFAQNETKTTELSENFEAKITAISYKVDSVEELKNIDWKGVKEIFSNNEDNQNIEISFAINLKKSKNKLNAKFSVKGESKKIDSLITNSKKGIKGLIKLANKYSKN